MSYKIVRVIADFKELVFIDFSRSPLRRLFSDYFSFRFFFILLNGWICLHGVLDYLVSRSRLLERT